MVSPGEHCKLTMAFIQALLPVVPVCMYISVQKQRKKCLQKVRKCWYFLLCIHHKLSQYQAFPLLLLLLLLCDGTCDL